MIKREASPGRTELSTTQSRNAGEGQAERRPALVFLRGELLAVPIPLEGSEVTLGRALDAAVRINDSQASRLHARIRTERDEATGQTRYRLMDLDSTNGTLLNGKTIDEAFLEDGDKFVIGDHMIRFEMLDEIDREFQQQIHRLLVHTSSRALPENHSSLSSAAKPRALKLTQTILRVDDGSGFFQDGERHLRSLAGSETLEEVGEVIRILCARATWRAIWR